MLKRKGKGVKTLRILRTQKNGVPVADPTHAEHIGFVFLFVVIGGIFQ